MTDRARAAVLTEFGRPLEIEEFPILDPEPGGLVVAVEAATVSSELASAASCALRSLIAAFNRLGSLDYRDTVLIQGAGPLGLFATAIASMHAPRSPGRPARTSRGTRRRRHHIH
jgi:D-arabinose 1-dehydrogenase-like Zn-dependent alcohol dehydrogenase